MIEKFQADYQQQGQQKHRHGVAKEHAHGKTGQQAAHQASEGNGDEPDQQSEGEYLFIFLAQNMKGHRNGENQRAAQHGCHEKAGIQTGGLGLAQLHGQGIAAHVVGDEDPHQRRIQTEQMKDRTQCRGQKSGQHRCQAEHAGHAQRQLAQCLKALIEGTSQLQMISGDTVDAADQRGDPHDP